LRVEAKLRSALPVRACSLTDVNDANGTDPSLQMRDLAI